MCRGTNCFTCGTEFGSLTCLDRNCVSGVHPSSDVIANLGGRCICNAKIDLEKCIFIELGAMVCCLNAVQHLNSVVRFGRHRHTSKKWQGRCGRILCVGCLKTIRYNPTTQSFKRTCRADCPKRGLRFKWKK